MRYVWLVILAMGCYEPPDYDGTHFKCDDAHGCPAGQRCIDGICGDGGSNATDAAPPSLGVQCGASVCTSGQKCCVDLASAPSCIPLASTCAGIAATCDGIEDCSGSMCCDGGGQTIACGTCATAVCRDNDDCTSAAAPVCCPDVVPYTPWGRCSPACP